MADLDPENRRPRPVRAPSQPAQLSRASTGGIGTGTGTGTGTNDIAPSALGSGNTPDMSDEESEDLSQHEPASPSEAAVKSESEGPPETSGSAGETATMPVQKRRRVTRACDECRRKKIKCDGKQPCSHCSIYSYECTYDKPSNRRRNPAPQYIEALETRLQRAEALLRKFMPDVDLSDPDLDPTVQQEFRTREQARAQAMLRKTEASEDHENQDAHIMSMIETYGQLDLNEGGEWDFHGISSGAVFLRRMKEHFQGLLGNEYRIPFLPRPSRPAGMFSLDSPRSNASSPWDVSAVPNIFDLPPRDKARTLCYYALNCATCLLRVVHGPSFYEMLDRLYETPQDSWGSEENRFLGLLYSVLALGSMYNITEDSPASPPVTYKSSMEEGTKYYASARLILQDVAECRDIISLQGLVYMILFLQSTSNISGCYAFLGIALRSSLRMGLHRNLTHAQITPIEDETRRRLFHVIRQLDTYVSAILGFPVLLRDEDVDQPAPTEVDDEYITADAILTPPPGTPSFFQAFNAHNRLMAMLSKVIKYIYPLKGVEDCAKSPSRPDATYMISYARIKEIERELHEWYEQLPTFWRPSNDGPIEVVRVRTLLRFSYAHVQMMLFRPFLHYVSPRLAAGKQIDDRYYNCAAAAISVSRNIVHIGIEIQKQSVLIGPYWFILYTEFFAIISLVFYVLENPDKPGSAEILADAQAGKDVIASLAQRSLAADRVTDALNALFEQLPDRLRKTTAKPAPSRKRSAPAPESTAGTVPLPVHAVLRESNPPKRRSEEIIRPQSSTVRREVPRRPQRTTSFDTVGLQQDGLTGQNFTANLQELLPLDIAMGGTGSDSSSTPSTAHRQLHGFQPPHTPIGSANALYKLDAVMFPGDPIAYPNQPLMDLASQHRGRQSSQGPPAGHIPDSMPFFIPNMYDEIEGQLLGPVPPYLVQQGHTTHLGLDPASQLYNTANMLTLQQSQRSSRHRHIVPSQQQQQHQHLLHQQQQQQQQQQHQQHRQNQHPHPHSHPHQQRQQDVTQRGQRDTLEGLLADPNFEGTGTYWVAQGFDGR